MIQKINHTGSASSTMQLIEERLLLLPKLGNFKPWRMISLLLSSCFKQVCRELANATLQFVENVSKQARGLVRISKIRSQASR